MRERKKKTVSAEAYKHLADSNHDLLVVMQAAYIEWQHGEGADAAMRWIANTLIGPGLIPGEDEPYSKEAQAYYSANKANPMPRCHCGRPSHIAWMGKGFCSEEHLNEAKAMRLQ